MHNLKTFGVSGIFEGISFHLTVLNNEIILSRYERKVFLHERYIKSLGIHLLEDGDCDLEQWEIPRDRIVINRKIGEGAFGVIYGGEAFFPEEGWVTIAAKAMKPDVDFDERLNFLSEVQVMKRLNHKNVVKLLGVCVRSDPFLSVMEFMLHGDLKTYLLARRHLVNDQCYESHDEISNQRLTAMALDVARALTYLVENKFVHRC